QLAPALTLTEAYNPPVADVVLATANRWLGLVGSAAMLAWAWFRARCPALTVPLTVTKPDNRRRSSSTSSAGRWAGRGCRRAGRGGRERDAARLRHCCHQVRNTKQLLWLTNTTQGGPWRRALLRSRLLGPGG